MLLIHICCNPFPDDRKKGYLFDQAERHDLFFSPFLFPPKKRGGKNENESKNRDQN